MSLTGSTIANRFRLDAVLGSGGMGSVYRAFDLRLEAPCAVKLLNRDIASRKDAVGRFRREAHAAARLRSPHVVQVLDVDVWEEQPFIAMELLEGESLSHRLRRLGRLPPRDVVAIAAQVCDALTAAHAAGIIHRDIKPGNIFLVRQRDGSDLVKVLDFGIAKIVEHAAALTDVNTREGEFFGTPSYMSPEQVRGQPVDH